MLCEDDPPFTVVFLRDLGTFLGLDVCPAVEDDAPGVEVDILGFVVVEEGTMVAVWPDPGPEVAEVPAKDVFEVVTVLPGVKGTLWR